MKKFFGFLLSAIVAISCTLAGCSVGGNGIGNTEKDLEIVLWQAGYGRDFLDSIKDAYMEKHPDVNISIVFTADRSPQPIYAAPDKNTVDLYFTSIPNYGAFVTYDSNGDGENERILEDLSGILDMKADGETKTLREKFGNNILNAVTNTDGKIYSLPWYYSLCGLIYNSDMFETNGWDFPTTTDELVSLALYINAEYDVDPFIQYADYWKYLYEAWVAQYEGVSTYQDMWKCIYTDADGKKYPNDVRFITESQGRYESYKALSRLIGPEGNVYYGSNTFDYMTAQTHFAAGEAAMMPNGSWVENEMKEISSQFHYGIMKTPVISAIIDVLPDKSVANDTELRALIKAIDSNNTNVVGTGYTVTQRDYDRVKEARNLFYIGGQADILMPAYSAAKDVAKDFLRFYFSDEAVQIAITQAGMLATVKKDSGEFDYSKNSNFVQDCHNKTQSSTILISSLVERLMYAGGIEQLFYTGHDPAIYLTYSENKSDFKEIDEYWSDERNLWIDHWNEILKRAGLQES